jgi:hypothetical protein
MALAHGMRRSARIKKRDASVRDAAQTLNHAGRV